MSKPNPFTKNYAVSHYQNLKEIPWPQDSKNSKNNKKFQENLKDCTKISIVLRVCVCSSSIVYIQEDRGGDPLEIRSAEGDH